MGPCLAFPNWSAGISEKEAIRGMTPEFRFLITKKDALEKKPWLFLHRLFFHMMDYVNAFKQVERFT